MNEKQWQAEKKWQLQVRMAELRKDLARAQQQIVRLQNENEELWAALKQEGKR